jgi:hypothetical protein
MTVRIDVKSVQVDIFLEKYFYNGYGNAVLNNTDLSNLDSIKSSIDKIYQDFKKHLIIEENSEDITFKVIKEYTWETIHESSFCEIDNKANIEQFIY